MSWQPARIFSTSAHALLGAGHKMAAWKNQHAARWIERALRSRLAQIILLVLALLPTAIVAVMVAHMWLSGNAATQDWQGKIWPVVILQVVSITAFWAHAGSNKSLVPGELGAWVMQFIVYIPFGMISYWNEHVWGQAIVRTKD
jgi:hypothetical protein